MNNDLKVKIHKRNLESTSVPFVARKDISENRLGRGKVLSGGGGGLEVSHYDRLNETLSFKFVF